MGAPQGELPGVSRETKNRELPGEGGGSQESRELPGAPETPRELPGAAGDPPGSSRELPCKSMTCWQAHEEKNFKEGNREPEPEPSIFTFSEKVYD